jgi:hypothetical protein
VVSSSDAVWGASSPSISIRTNTNRWALGQAIEERLHHRRWASRCVSRHRARGDPRDGSGRGVVALRKHHHDPRGRVDVRDHHRVVVPGVRAVLGQNQ